MASCDEIKSWGIALERLREDRGIAKTELCYRARMGLPEYRVICHELKKGPSVETLGRLLEALECSWGEWGNIYDAVQAGMASKQEPVGLKPAVNDHRTPGGARSKHPLPRGTPPLPRLGRKATP